MTSETTSPVMIGRVKWFNNKAGYGFVTVIDCEDDSFRGTDVFAHHSSVTVKNTDQYRYLVQGEYVEFELKTVEGSDHKHQASNVRGLKGGNLLCETRLEVRAARPSRSAGGRGSGRGRGRVTRPNREQESETS
jgi:cold shock CspA family protein